jgi:hypothetical protein
MGFKVLQKLFTTLYNYYIFICFFETLTNFENAYLNSPHIPFSVIGQCSLMRTSHWLQGKCARINAPQYDFTEPQAAYPVAFLVSKSPLNRVFEAGLLKGCSKLVSIFGRGS